MLKLLGDHINATTVALERLERDVRGPTDALLDFYKLAQKEEQEKNRGQTPI